MRFYRGDAGDKPTLFYGGTQPAGVIVHGEDAWFPTNRGLWRIRPAEFDIPSLTHLLIGAVTVDGKAAASGASVVLPAGASRLEVAYEPILLSSQENLLFHYRLVGFDKDWTLAGATQRSATYTNLPSGKYTFQVEAWQREHPDARVQVALQLARSRTSTAPRGLSGCLLIAGLVAIGAYQMRIRTGTRPL